MTALNLPSHGYPIRHPQTASRVFGRDAVVITPAENTVRMLNPTGTRVWQLADGTHTVEEIALALTQEFEVDYTEALASTQQFIALLEEKGLLTWTPTS